MEQVGYDMYNRLLNEVVKETRGEKVEEEEDITIDIKTSAYIPDNYIEDSSQKIEIYQDIANCKDDKDIQDIIDEIIDRYGDMPNEVENLID
ncbi:TRCF domain-containing protein, partial [uncultured Methanobrevibacter sp.]|uniref:TRCF domain-containing protein n=1 Tax=uncultured Methanobrevibacter sp. TaxID=253161 RepID=UPI0025F60CB1